MSSETTEGAGLIDVLAWLEVNKKRLAVGAGLAVAAGFGIYVANHMAREKEFAASGALLELRAPLNAGTNAQPIAASAYLGLAEANAGTAAAERAQLMGAGTLFTEGKYSEAQSKFEKFASENPGSAWVGSAAYGVAASLEAQGKRDEALTAYQRIITGYASDAVATEARMAAARIYEAKNQPELALQVYEEVGKPGGMSMQASDALMRKERLLKKNPHLIKPMAPATNAVSMPALPAAAAPAK